MARVRAVPEEFRVDDHTRGLIEERGTRSFMFERILVTRHCFRSLIFYHGLGSFCGLIIGPLVPELGGSMAFSLWKPRSA